MSDNGHIEIAMLYREKMCSNFKVLGESISRLAPV